MSASVDIIMGIYNCAGYIDECICSVLNQTFTDWRLIICDDGSTDATFTAADRYAREHKDRILLIKNETNRGLNYTLNRCLEMSDAKFIARMDGDDYCSADRLMKEMLFLEENPQYAFVSSFMSAFDSDGVWGVIKKKECPGKMDFLKESPFNHAPVLIRAEALKAVGGYTVDDRLLRVEDYHLWFKLYAAGFKGYTIPESLYFMRDDKSARKRRTWKNRLNEYYVKKTGYRMLDIPWYCRIFMFRSIIIGLLPQPIYKLLHRMKNTRG